MNEYLKEIQKNTQKLEEMNKSLKERQEKTDS